MMKKIYIFYGIKNKKRMGQVIIKTDQEFWYYHKILVIRNLIFFIDFNLSSIRDKKQIVGICTSIGICPMISFARAIYEKNIDKLLTIFYLVKDQNNILYKRELDELAKNQDIKIVYVNKNRGGLPRFYLFQYFAYFFHSNKNTFIYTT